MSDPVRLIIMITTQPGQGHQQAEAFNRLAPLVRAEPGCLQYDLHQVTGDPDRFVLLEEWASREALAAHDDAPHMIEAGIANKEFRSGPAQVIEFHHTPIA
ncbi:putative quinol monooxygenase [Nocardia sp. NPDC004722]